MNCRNVDLSCINKKNSSSSKALKLGCSKCKNESSYSIECLFIFNLWTRQLSTRSIKFFVFLCIVFLFTKYACIFENRLLDKPLVPEFLFCFELNSSFTHAVAAMTKKKRSAWALNYWINLENFQMRRMATTGQIVLCIKSNIICVLQFSVAIFLIKCTEFFFKCECQFCAYKVKRM